jgi:hypothetical protein
MTNDAERASTGWLLGTAATPAAEADAVEPFGSYERAALDLTVGIDALGHAIDRHVADRRLLLKRHIALVVAARAVCVAWAEGSLERADVLALSAAIAAASVLDPTP